MNGTSTVMCAGTPSLTEASKRSRRAPTSFLQAMVRDRVVADDWLVSIDGNRYSALFVLIGKTVQVVREGGS
jgi:hypothetical protein